MVRRYTTRRSTYRRRPFRRTRTTRTRRTYRNRRPTRTSARRTARQRKINRLRTTGRIQGMVPRIRNLPAGDFVRYKSVSTTWFQTNTFENAVAGGRPAAHFPYSANFFTSTESEIPGFKDIAENFSCYRVVKTRFIVRAYFGNPIEESNDVRAEVPILVLGFSGLPSGASVPIWYPTFKTNTTAFFTMPEEQPHTVYRILTNSGSNPRSLCKLTAVYNTASSYSRSSIRTSEKDLVTYDGNVAHIFDGTSKPEISAFCDFWLYGPMPIGSVMDVPYVFPFQLTIERDLIFTGRRTQID